ncbi:MAG TPA: endonuclease/exonuclease/phosphatase family protein, partial [Humisphaera sp.]
VMRREVDARRGDAAVVVTGDFNSTEDQPQYRTLTLGGDGAAGGPLADAYRAVHPAPGADEASFHGFRGTTRGKRIDWILSSPELVAAAATIDRTNKDGRYPSDHFAVTADFAWKP